MEETDFSKIAFTMALLTGAPIPVEGVKRTETLVEMAVK